MKKRTLHTPDSAMQFWKERMASLNANQTVGIAIPVAVILALHNNLGEQPGEIHTDPDLARYDIFYALDRETRRGEKLYPRADLLTAVGLTEAELALATKEQARQAA